METNQVTILEPKATSDFVETPYIKDVTNRALNYVKAGFPIHLRGISGTGKTTLALRVAQILGRPMIMIHGDEELGTADLVGGEYGFYSKRVHDNYIHSVVKVEEEGSKRWVDNRLTVAVEHGYTLIYDEFTRSRPEANNVLLSVLQEGILDLPAGRGGEGNYLKNHPNFVAIFTSNPEEYAGVHRSQDALRDRMITMDIKNFDFETEIAITKAKSNLSATDAKKIVSIVRHLRDSGQYEFAPTVRSCIMIAKSIQVHNGVAKVAHNNEKFRQICLDILASATSRIGNPGTSSRVMEIVNKAIEQYCKNGEQGSGFASPSERGMGGRSEGCRASRSPHHK